MLVPTGGNGPVVGDGATVLGGGGSKMKIPFCRRDVLVDWDHGVQLPAVEVRPGIAVCGDIAVTARRLKELGRSPTTPLPALDPARYVDEVDHLLRRLEGTDAGRRLVGFFASARPLPDRRGKTLEGDHGQDDPTFGINPRRWKAVSTAEPQERVAITVVILQSEELVDECHVLPTGLAGACAGLGAAPTVVFGPRDVLLIDRVVLAPELVLGHELVHAAHVVSGCMSRGPSVHKADTRSPEGLASALFTAETGRNARQFTAWLDRANEAAFAKLTAGQQSRIKDMDALHTELLGLARRAFSPVMPVREKPTGGVVFQKPVVDLEEAKTHGSDLTSAWFHGVHAVVDLRRIRPTSAELDSDSAATGEVQRLERILNAKSGRPKSAELAALASARLVRKLRLGVRDVTEVLLARQLGLPTRTAYAPTLSKQESGGVVVHLDRPLRLSVPRAALPDAAFSEEAPHTALRSALAKVTPEPGFPNPATQLDEYVAALTAWEAGNPAPAAASGWKPGDTPLTGCVTGKPIATATVDQGAVPQQAREWADELDRDVTDHPGMSVDDRGNEHLRRATAAPLPPAPTS
ncbi:MULTISPECIES: hypothetical protein [Actinosynnema]|uniref:hypothetical protein n=1 Tax=Actinosynnema TaxID=40566 RepID=UPI0020A41783|nr:hypothetical protein [Actinosynnema pretiosum]MCP2098797.1 hypothetical protein [Actinosynnema pretiosum]